jgi:histidinol-phosphate aminotransferase
MIIRDRIRSFKPYEWEPSTAQIASKVGLPAEQIIRYDTNVSPYLPTKLLSKLGSILPKLRVNDYPDASYSDLRQALSRYTGFGTDQITVTNGADEALDMIAKLFIDPQTEVLISTPTYSMYRIVVEVMGGKVKNVQRKKNFADDIDALLNSVSEKTRTIFICSPNNPTANTTPRKDIIRLLDESDCGIIVDESYFEFCGRTVADLIEKYDNLIVIRTLSKAFSLAGLRLGYIIASKKTINQLNIVRPPNSVGVISLALAQIALEKQDLMRKNVKKIIAAREKLRKTLEKIKGLKVYPSEANFLLVCFEKIDAEKVYNQLLKQGIVSKSLTDLPGLQNCLRFTVRTPEENNILAECLRRILEK